ncbi:MAG TPA: PLD nuclease N-terminal domain-containing protein [Pirellulales bacterium]|nr:PLD nuclease N-terminal domain-containing protein [Pirellulales bacterium]
MNPSTLFAQAAPDVNNAAGLFGGAMVLVVLFWIVGIAATVFWLWMMIDALTNEPTTERKILWFLVIFFLHFIGAFIYLLMGRGGRASSSAAR